MMLVYVRGRWAVSQKHIMGRTGYVASSGCTVHRLAKRSDRVIARKLERESNHEKRNEGGGGGKKRKRFPANPTIL